MLFVITHIPLIHTPEAAAGGVNQTVCAPAVPAFSIIVCGVLAVCAEANGTWRLVRPTRIANTNKTGAIFLPIKLRPLQTIVLVAKEAINFATSVNSDKTQTSFSARSSCFVPPALSGHFSIDHFRRQLLEGKKTQNQRVSSPAECYLITFHSNVIIQSYW